MFPSPSPLATIFIYMLFFHSFTSVTITTTDCVSLCVCVYSFQQIQFVNLLAWNFFLFSVLCRHFTVSHFIEEIYFIEFQSHGLFIIVCRKHEMAIQFYLLRYIYIYIYIFGVKAFATCSPQYIRIKLRIDLQRLSAEPVCLFCLIHFNNNTHTHKKTCS